MKSYSENERENFAEKYKNLSIYRYRFENNFVGLLNNYIRNSRMSYGKLWHSSLKVNNNVQINLS